MTSQALLFVTKIWLGSIPQISDGAIAIANIPQSYIFVDMIATYTYTAGQSASHACTCSIIKPNPHINFNNTPSKLTP